MLDAISDRWASSSCQYHAPVDATLAAPVEDVFSANFHLAVGSCLDDLTSAERMGLNQLTVFVAFLEAFKNGELLT